MDGRCVRHDGTLAGAFLDMASAVRNAVRLAGAWLEQALHYASAGPAAFLGVKGRPARARLPRRHDRARSEDDRGTAQLGRGSHGWNAVRMT